MRFKYIPQSDESDCGVACLSMILAKHGSYIGLSKLRELLGTDSDGTSAYEMVKVAKSFDLQTRAVKGDISIFDDENTIFPFIAHVVKAKKMLHYYVVIKVDKNNVEIADPDPHIGIKTVSKEAFLEEWTGVAIFFEPSKNYQKQSGDRINQIKYRSILRKHIPLFFSIVLSSLLLSAINLIVANALKEFVDVYVSRRMTGLLYAMGLGIALCYIISSIMLWFQNIMLTILGQRISKELNLKYLKHVFKLPLTFFQERRIGELISRFSDSTHVTDFLANTIATILVDAITILITGLFLLHEDIVLFSIVLAVLPMNLLIVHYFTKKFYRLGKEVMEKNSLVNSEIIDDLRGIETLKALNIDSERVEKQIELYETLLSKDLEYDKVYYLQQALKKMLEGVLNLSIILIGTLLVRGGSLTLGSLLEFMVLLSYFIAPLQEIITLQSQMQTSIVAKNRIEEILSLSSEYKQKSINNIDDLDGEISFKHVSFGYPARRNILTDVNYTIKAGEKVAFIGKSGSGKSTLMKLLVNFFQVKNGEIQIGGVDVENIDKRSLRSYINYTPQEGYICPGTIKENVLLGTTGTVTNIELRQVCEIAGLWAEIEEGEIDLDENAEVLSGGQKKRVLIARALLSGSKVLVFDEVTSGLDPKLADKVICNLIGIKSKTMIFVTHQTEIGNKMDKTFLVRNGVVRSLSSDEI